MPKYRIRLTHYIEEVCDVVVEADSKEAAEAATGEIASMADGWSDGPGGMSGDHEVLGEGDGEGEEFRVSSDGEVTEV